MFKKKSTPRGFRHIWGYRGVWNEQKIAPRTWKFRFVASKGKKSSTYGSFRKGFNVTWKINAIQKATKTGKGKYQTIMTGTKKQLRTGYKRARMH